MTRRSSLPTYLTLPVGRFEMSELQVYFVRVPSGLDIVQYLKDFIAKHDLKAAFIISSVGKISQAKIRLADASAGFDPTQQITSQAWIESLVGTLSSGGHLHISLTNSRGIVLGGHVFGPLVASGLVDVIVGQCLNFSFARSPDVVTGYNELVVTPRDILHQVTKDKPAFRSPSQLPPSPQEGQQVSKMAAHGGSAIKVFALRLGPGEEIVESLKSLVAKENLKAAFIMTCVGSVTKARIRLAHDPTAKPTNKIIDMEGHFEIVSLVGTLADPAHLHISLSDMEGTVIGGHVIGNLIVFTTAELVIGECLDYHMVREMDSRTGFPELAVKHNLITE